MATALSCASDSGLTSAMSGASTERISQSAAICKAEMDDAAAQALEETAAAAEEAAAPIESAQTADLNCIEEESSHHSFAA